VGHFVEQDKECIAGDKFHPIDTLLLGETLEAGIALERTRELF
jgi:hypothetical protein